jgi:glycosyltransferase involved in cell wall biosynthesis
MWIAAHVPAAQLRARRPDLHWSAEMSDPLSRDVRGNLREAPLPAGDPVVIELRDAARERGHPVPATDHLGVFVEHVAYALADEIVFTNEHQRAYMLGYCPVPALARRAEQISVIRPQPTLPARYYELEPARLDGDRLAPDRVRLAYFGNLYANRSLEDAVGALADLPGPERAHVALAVFTSTPDLVRDQVRDLGLDDVVDVQAYVPYLQFLNVLRHFDCLVIEDVTTTGTAHHLNPYLPSKWADYRGSGTPVWGIVEDGSPLSREALHYRSPRGDRRAALATLRQIVRDRDQEAAGAGGRAPK